MDVDHKASFIISKLEEFGLIDDYFEALRRPDAASRMRSGLAGFLWEDQFAAECQKRGYSVKLPPNKNSSYDHLINGLRVQAKSSGLSRLSIDLRSHKGMDTSDRRAYASTDVDIMAIKNLSTREVFIVPVSHLLDPKHPGYVRGRVRWETLAEFKDNWDVLKPSVDRMCLDMFEEMDALRAA